MSTTVDERVVEMRFDNKNFESNVEQSMSTLEKLKAKLNLNGAAKGLDDVNKAANNFDASNITTALDSIKSNFSALQVIGVTALQNITNSAINAGKKMLSALTIDPIKSGLSEYETKINAVQTIYANTKSKGTTMDQINSALAELNEYADMTIYNFAEMTKNIGTFTAAGVDLETSVASIKGIANLAAVSGSTSQQASTAMYQLSQALAAGKVNLMDWNSVVNAGMGGEIFQNALIRTSELLGTGAKAAVAANGTFRTSLTESGWLTTEVLTETLKQISGAYNKVDLMAQGYTEAQADEIVELAATAVSAATDIKTASQLWDALKESAQSGWATTWELIFGDYEEAKQWWSEVFVFVSGILDKINDARNTLIKSALAKSFGELRDKINAVLKPALQVTTTFQDVTSAMADMGSIVDDVILGKFGNGTDRFNALTEAGINYYAVQNRVNETLGDSFRWSEEQIQSQYELLGTQQQVVASTSDLSDATVELTDEEKQRLETLLKTSDAELRAKGYTQEQIDALHELGDTVDKLGMSVDDFLTNVNDIDGRWLLLDSFKNIGNGIYKILKAIADALTPIDPDKVFDVIAAFHKFSEALVISDEAAEKITRTFKGVFAVFGIVKDVISAVFSVVKTLIRPLTNNLGGLGSTVLDVTANIGDSIVSFREWLKGGQVIVNALNTAITWIYSTVGKVINKVKDLWNAFKNMPQVQKAMEAFRSFLSKFKIEFGDYFSGGIQAIRDFIGRIKELDGGISLSNIKAIFQDFKDNVLGYFLGIEGKFDSVTDKISAFKAKIKSLLPNIGSAFTNFKETVVNVFDTIASKFNDKIGFAGVFTALFGTGVVVSIKKLGDALSAIKAPIEEITKIPSNINGMLGSISGFFDTMSANVKKKMTVEIIEAVCSGLLKIAIAIAILAFVADGGNLDKAVLALAELAGIFVAMVAALLALNKVLGGSDAKKVSGMVTTVGSVIAIALAVKMLAGVLKTMEGLDEKKMQSNLLVIAAMGIALVGLAVVLSKFGGESMAGAIGVVAIALALKILVGALEDLEGLRLTATCSTILILGELIGGLILVSVASRAVKFSSAVGILILVAAIKLLIAILVDLAAIPLKTIKAGIEGLSPIMTAIAEFMVLSLVAGKNAVKAGAMILMISAGLFIMVAVIKLLGTIKNDELKRGRDSVEEMLAMFTILMGVSKLAGDNAAKAGAMILMVAGAILILTAAIVILAHVDNDGLTRATAAIAVLEIMFGALIAVTKLASNCEKTIMMIAITIGVLVASLALLTFVDQEALKNVTLCLTIVIGAVAILVAASALLSKSWTSLMMIAIIIAVIGGVLFLLCQLPTDTVIPIAEKLVEILLALSVACTVIGLVGLAGGAILVGIAAFAAAIVGVGLLMAALSGLVCLFPDLEEFLDKGISLLGKIGEGIGTFFGELVGSFLENMGDSLPGFADDLSDFMTRLQPFLDGASNINETAVNGIKNLAKMIIVLTAADLISGLTSWIFGDDYEKFSSFSESLKPLGTALADFSNEVKDINLEAVRVASNAGLKLAEMANAIPNSGGLLGKIFGDNDMDDFGGMMGTFADGIVAFSNKIVEGNLDINAVELGTQAGVKIAEMADKIPNTGGILADIVGDNDMDTFGTQLEKFGQAIVAFANTVTGLDSGVVENAATAGNTMIAMADTIPNTGGVVSWFTGDNDMGEFGNKLLLFGVAISTFAVTVGGLNIAAVGKASIAGQMMAEMANNLPNTGGIKTWFEGDNDMATFGKQLVKFGEGLSEFSTKIENVDADAVENAAACGTMLAELASSLPTSEGFFTKLFSGSDDMDSFGKTIASFGDSLSSFYESVKDVDMEQLEGAVDKMSQVTELATQLESLGDLSDKLAKFGEQGVNAFVSSFTDADEKMVDAVDNMVTDLENAVSGKQNAVETAGKVVVDNFVSGIDSNSTIPSEKIVYIVSLCVTDIRAKYTDFYNAGGYLATGFAIGLKDSTWYSTYYAKAMAKAAADAAAKELDENSPSKVGYKIGDFFGQGFSNGVANTVDSSYDAGSSMGLAAKNGLNNAVSKIGEFIESGIDSQPVIRPILDLSSVKKDAGKLSSYLSRSQALSINSDFGSSVSVSGQNGNSSTYSFVQNNYSPKALSRVDIYRQTKNQFSAMERMVSST